MSDPNHYLLEDTPESQRMALHLRDMLESKDKEQLLLAFRLMFSGGVPTLLIPHLYMLDLLSYYGWMSWPQTRMLLLKFAPGHYKSLLRRLNSDDRNLKRERFLARILDEIAREEQLDKQALGRSTWKITGSRGYKFCLEQCPDMRREILQSRIEAYGADKSSLWLDGLDLDFLPEEIAAFTQVKVLHISNNNLKALPEVILAMPALEQIYCNRNPGAAYIHQQITSLAPHIMAHSGTLS